MAILAIAWAVLGLMKLWTDRRRHRNEMDLMEAYTAEMRKLAAEARASACPECRQPHGKHKLSCNRGRVMPENLH